MTHIYLPSVLLVSSLLRLKPIQTRVRVQIQAALLSLSLSLLFSLCLTSYARAEPVSISVDQAYPPYMYAVGKAAAGLYPRLLEAAFARMGQDVDIKPYPWKRALHLGAVGKAGIAGIYKNSERLKVYHYSAPLYKENLVIYVKAGSAFPFTDIEDLRGKRVGLNFGWSYGDAIDAARKAKVFEADDSVKDNLLNFRKLVGGRVDCFIVDELAALQIISKQGLQGKVERLAKPISVNPGYLVFSKGMNQLDLLHRVNMTLLEMRADGSYKEIVNSLVYQSDVD